MAKESIKRSKRQKGKGDTEKKCFLGFTGLQWTAFGVFVAIVGIILGGIALCRQGRGREKSNGKDSSFIYYKDETPSRVDTVVHIRQDEEEPSDTTQEPDSSTLKVTDPKLDSTCAIFYLKGDSIAREDALAIKGFLLNKKRSLFQNYPFKEYPLVEKDTNWFITNFPYEKVKEDTFNLDVLIFYNDPKDAKLDQRLYRAMKEGIFGIVYTETFAAGWERNLENKGNGVLKRCRFTDVNGVLLGEKYEKLRDYNFALVIPPYFNAAILDSVYFPSE